MARRVKRPRIENHELQSAANADTINKNAQGGRGKRKEMSGMLELPVETHLEVLTYLWPMDLLNIARTNKWFRTMLMRRNAIRSWKRARCNVEGLPNCPQDLSEPAYANLMFDPHCHFCFRKNCHKVYWEARVRLCPKCIDKSTIDFLPELNKMLGPKSHESLANVLMPDVLPTFYCKQPQEGLHSQSWYLPAYEAFDTMISRHDATEIVEFIRKRIKWYQRDRAKRSDELRKIRGTRRESIITKLKETGWDEEVRYMDTISFDSLSKFKKLPDVAKTQPLTPKIWSNIRSRMVTFMQEVREERQIYVRKVAFRDRLANVEDVMRRVIPRFKLETPSALEVVICIPEVNAIAGLLAQDFDPDVLLEILERTLPAYIENRLQDARRYLGGLVKTQIDLDESVDPLALAVGSRFVCHCGTSHSFPSVLGHRCSWGAYWEEDHVKFAILGSNGRYFLWRPKHFRTDVSVLDPLVRAFGLDPQTATIADMDAVDTRLECTKHIKPDNPQLFRIALSWRASCLSRRKLLVQGDCAYVSLPESQATVARGVEPTVWARLADKRAHERNWQCALCSELESCSQVQVKEHIRTKHDIANPAHEDFIDMKNSEPVDLLPIVLYSVTAKAEAPTNAQQLIASGLAAWCDLSTNSECNM